MCVAQGLRVRVEGLRVRIISGSISRRVKVRVKAKVEVPLEG